MQELKERGLLQYKISKLVNMGKLIKLIKSYFENINYCGEESDFYYVEAYAPKGVICLLSAASYYNLTTYIPDAVDVAIPRKAKMSTIPDWPPMKFQICNMEKTVVDIIYYRKKISIEEMKEIMVNYLRRKERNLNRLIQYAQLMKCEKVMRQYLDVLL